jgi:dTDP-4-dehydrorhamnose reductase
MRDKAAMRILLFGGSGVMGTALDHVCCGQEIPCIQLSHADVDVTDGAAVVTAIKSIEPTVVINAVALIGYDVCEKKPLEAFRINSLPASIMAQECEENGIVFVQLSTHAVFDGRKEEAYREDDLPNPLNSYASTKYLAELYCRNLCRQHYVVRLPTLFGPRRNDRPGFVDKILARINCGEDLIIAADKIDSPTYSFDVAFALVKLLIDRLPHGTYHLANQGAVSYFDFVATIVQLLGSTVKITPVMDRDFPFTGIKPLKTAMASGRIAPLRTWQDALQDYLGIEVAA